MGICRGNYDNTLKVSGTTEEFPITFILDNIPGSHLGFTIQYGGNDPIIEYCQYAPMTTNQGLNMYFAVNQENYQMQIDSISVSYSYNLT